VSNVDNCNMCIVDSCNVHIANNGK
jgi:hypothetical protein